MTPSARIVPGEPPGSSEARRASSAIGRTQSRAFWHAVHDPRHYGSREYAPNPSITCQRTSSIAFRCPSDPGPPYQERRFDDWTPTPPAGSSYFRATAGQPPRAEVSAAPPMLSIIFSISWLPLHEGASDPPPPPLGWNFPCLFASPPLRRRITSRLTWINKEMPGVFPVRVAN
jgi:hypothetical protein